MTLDDFAKVYTGNASISIFPYCEEEEYDFYALPDPDEENFLGDNPNHYIPSCLARESWYKEIKDKTITKLTVIGGGYDTVEVCIKLGD